MSIQLRLPVAVGLRHTIKTDPTAVGLMNSFPYIPIKSGDIYTIKTILLTQQTNNSVSVWKECKFMALYKSLKSRNSTITHSE